MKAGICGFYASGLVPLYGPSFDVGTDAILSFCFREVDDIIELVLSAASLDLDVFERFVEVGLRDFYTADAT